MMQNVLCVFSAATAASNLETANSDGLLFIPRLRFPWCIHICAGCSGWRSWRTGIGRGFATERLWRAGVRCVKPSSTSVQVPLPDARVNEVHCLELLLQRPPRSCAQRRAPSLVGLGGGECSYTTELIFPGLKFFWWPYISRYSDKPCVSIMCKQ